jgi:hypothetical protein
MVRATASTSTGPKEDLIKLMKSRDLNRSHTEDVKLSVLHTPYIIRPVVINSYNNLS